MKLRPSIAALCLCAMPLALAAAPARADLPEPVRAMIEAATKVDDPATVEAVVKVALQTNPDATAEIEAMRAKFAEAHQLREAEKAAETQQRIRAAHALQLWKGEVEAGAFRSTGNTDNLGLSLGLKLNRKGLDWEHKLQLRADYQEERGKITREQYLAAYSPHYQLEDGLYSYGLAQFERDRFQGYDSRYSLSGGFGYRVIDRKAVKLSFEGGPALRRTDFIAEPDKTSWSALAKVDLDFRIAQAVKLSQAASAYVESENSTFTSATAIEAGMAHGLRARFSYTYEHETDPVGVVLRTDTLSRFTLVYGF
ncbi:DUF481 domain-containing protein [Novosphingobium album (ex Liu et al. 2023)]|uniref:DUF481 domain-containing protein n=1 Tax=Novosphingobium album (ex Liu et al. 2023) TaxID=3031130 RepID=A0ABT5WUS3_9SPHN|nr:DUF481 domain-containing protein [Novosphingobium album (ex Liu et al. 2023)]MDE8653649.1 DUF481 domain-containing protein [Novosphingobium album (ex Liu et al. 2023)]